jgi:hypothetical protein
MTERDCILHSEIGTWCAHEKIAGDCKGLPCEFFREREKAEMEGGEEEMSYSLNTKCHDCKKSVECTDHEVIRGAVDTIHMIGYNKSHKGGGSIELDCQNFEAKEEEPAAEAKAG